jgi:hypothetical protein
VAGLIIIINTLIFTTLIHSPQCLIINHKRTHHGLTPRLTASPGIPFHRFKLHAKSKDASTTLYHQGAEVSNQTLEQLN